MVKHKGRVTNVPKQ